MPVLFSILPLVFLFSCPLFAKQNAWFQGSYLKGVNALPGKDLNEMNGKEDERV